MNRRFKESFTVSTIVAQAEAFPTKQRSAPEGIAALAWRSVLGDTPRNAPCPETHTDAMASASALRATGV